MKLSDMKRILEQRKSSKHNVLVHFKTSLVNMVADDIDTRTFECNAINILQEMQKIKAEIDECEHMLLHINTVETL